MKCNALQHKRQWVRHKNIIGIDPGLSRQSSGPGPIPQPHIDVRCVQVECSGYSLYAFICLFEILLAFQVDGG